MATSSFARRFGLGRRARRDRSRSILLIAVGAAAGVAIGMVIADRVGGMEGLLRRRSGSGGGGKRGSQPLIAGWRRDERRSETFDELSDDDSELSPESIAHMHVRGDRNATAEDVRIAADARNADPRSTEARSAQARGADARGAGARPGQARSSRGTKVRALPVRHTPDEAALEARVLEAFMNDPILKERAIDICASGSGTIELTGWVQANSEIGHALVLARGVPDVSSVIDRLAVRGAEPSLDHSGYRYAGPPPGGEAPPIRAD
jgi:hypothetical protein